MRKFKEKKSSTSFADVGFAMGSFLLFRPGLPTCSLRWAQLSLRSQSHSALQHEGKKKEKLPQLHNMPPWTAERATGCRQSS